MSTVNLDLNRAKRLARELDLDGYVLRKSRKRYLTQDDLGGYMIFDAQTNLPVHGRRWDLDLNDVEAWMRDEV